MARGVTRIVDDKVVSTYRKGCQWNRRSTVDQSTAPAGAPNHLIRNNVAIGDAGEPIPALTSTVIFVWPNVNGPASGNETFVGSNVLSVMVGFGLNEGSASGVAVTTIWPPVPPGVNVTEVDELGSLKVPPDELHFTVFGMPFVTAALRVIG
jgi:hypothetical protein